MEILASIPSPSESEIQLGPLPLRGYALCIIIGVFLAIWLGGRRWVRRGGQPGTVADIAVWAVPFGLVGARVYHVVTDYQLYFGEGRDWVDSFKIWDGGIGIWGAVAGGALGAWIACRRRGIALPPMADAVAPGIAFAQAIGRWGNWFNQELYGKSTDLPWAVEIDNGLHNGTFHPTFLYESLWCLGVGLLVLWADRRFRLGHGRAFALYVAAYTVGRAWIEYLRIDEAHEFFGLRLNDWTALVVFVGAVLYLVISAKRRPGREESVEPAPADEGDGSSAPAAAEKSDGDNATDAESKSSHAALASTETAVADAGPAAAVAAAGDGDGVPTPTDANTDTEAGAASADAADAEAAATHADPDAAEAVGADLETVVADAGAAEAASVGADAAEGEVAPANVSGVAETAEAVGADLGTVDADAVVDVAEGVAVDSVVAGGDAAVPVVADAGAAEAASVGADAAEGEVAPANVSGVAETAEAVGADLGTVDADAVVDVAEGVAVDPVVTGGDAAVPVVADAGAAEAASAGADAAETDVAPGNTAEGVAVDPEAADADTAQAAEADPAGAVVAAPAPKGFWGRRKAKAAGQRG